MALSLDGTTGISATGNITGGNVIASGSLIVGTFTPASLTSAGNISGGNLLTAGIMSSTGNAIHGNILTAGIMSSTGNITGGNILTAGVISATGTITSAGNLSLTGNIVDIGELWINTTANGNINLNVNGTGQTNIPTGILSVTGNIQGGNVRTAGLISATGNITGGNLLTAGIMSSTGNITGGNLTVSTGNITLGNLVNAGSNGAGNIGSATAYFNTGFLKATTAQYADLAENYEADGTYRPGTVLVFGGNNEVTMSTVNADPRVAGVVSSNPAHLMNSTLDAEHTVALALQGRVLTNVTGTIRKGDMMVTASNGYAQACTTPAMGTVLGKALEDFDGVGMSGVIEIVVGRL